MRGDLTSWQSPVAVIVRRSRFDRIFVVVVIVSVTLTVTVRRIKHFVKQKGKASPYSIAERTVPELIPVLGSQPAGDMSHKPGGRLPLGLLSARPAVTFPAHRSVPISLLGEQRHDGCEQFA